MNWRRSALLGLALMGLTLAAWAAGAGLASAKIPTDYLWYHPRWPDLMLTGDRHITYSACTSTSPHPFTPLGWGLGVENWDGAMSGMDFGYVECVNDTQVKLNWSEDLVNDCGPGGAHAAGCAVFTWPENANWDMVKEARVYFDYDKYMIVPSWQTTIAAHEWGHILGLEDHDCESMCDAQRIMGDNNRMTRDDPCLSGPSARDVENVLQYYGHHQPYNPDIGIIACPNPSLVDNDGDTLIDGGPTTIEINVVDPGYDLTLVQYLVEASSGFTWSILQPGISPNCDSGSCRTSLTVDDFPKTNWTYGITAVAYDLAGNRTVFCTYNCPDNDTTPGGNNWYHLRTGNGSGSSPLVQAAQSTPPYLKNLSASTASGVGEGVAASTPAGVRVNLNWTDTQGESGFAIQKKVGTGLFFDLKTVSANTTSYSDTLPSSQEGKTLTYRVRAWFWDTSYSLSNEPSIDAPISPGPQPVCANGTVEEGEECDPPGSWSLCSLGSGQEGVKYCQSNCRWAACQQKSCYDQCPNAGQEKCDGRDIYKCTYNGQMCREWTYQRTCTPGTVCSGSGGAVQCSPFSCDRVDQDHLFRLVCGDPLDYGGCIDKGDTITIAGYGVEGRTVTVDMNVYSQSGGDCSQVTLSISECTDATGTYCPSFLHYDSSSNPHKSWTGSVSLNGIKIDVRSFYLHQYCSYDLTIDCGPISPASVCGGYLGGYASYPSSQFGGRVPHPDPDLADPPYCFPDNSCYLYRDSCPQGCTYDAAGTGVCATCPTCYIQNLDCPASVYTNQSFEIQYEYYGTGGQYRDAYGDLRTAPEYETRTVQRESSFKRESCQWGDFGECRWHSETLALTAPPAPGTYTYSAQCKSSATWWTAQEMCGLGDSKAFCTVDVLTPPPSPCDSYADVDGDGYVTYVDIGIISGFLEGTGSLTPEQKLRADINGDGAVTQADIDGIKAYLDGLSPTVPLCEDADNNGLPSYQEDDDNDGFVTWVELYLGTDPQDNCPDSSSDDAWPLDINKDRLITVVGDISNFSGRIGTKAGNPNYSQRLDFNTDGHITVVGDISLYRGHIPQSCS